MKKTISQLRDEIDSLDLKILRLIEQRAILVKEVGEVKGKTSSPIYVPEREENIFTNLAENSNVLTYENIRGIFTEIISSCRNLEKHLTVYTFGELTPLVAYRIFGNAVSLKQMDSLGFMENSHKEEEFFLIPSALDQNLNGYKTVVSQIFFSGKKYILLRNSKEFLDNSHVKINTITFAGGTL